MGLAGLGVSGLVLLVVAPLIGSFLGVVIRRLPEGRGFAWGRSHCPHCAAVLAPRDLVPLASWIAAAGRCRHCGQWLGWFYPGVEAAAFTLAALSLLLDPSGPIWLDWGLGCWLLVLAWIDVECWLLPDALTLPLIVLGLGAAALFAPDRLFDCTAGTAAGYLGLRAVAWTYRRLRGRDGLGGGDAKLFAAAGAWVGASGLPSVLLLAALAALIAAGLLGLAGMSLHRHSALPFGPFLALAAWLVWMLGPVSF